MSAQKLSPLRGTRAIRKLERMEYVVRDRSILLPAYKRFVIAPTLPVIPRALHPNFITHTGHVINMLGAALLLASGAKSGWPFLVTALALQLYNWCDNADGGHARRTDQCSPLGELLDHGLDMLNIVYIALVAATAIGASATWTAAIAIVLPAACAVTYWEQAETGLFSLGTLNQIESVMLLTLVLGISAVFGTEVWERIAIGPLTARLAILAFVVGGALVGIAGNLRRVLKTRGLRSIVRGAPHLHFVALVFVAVPAGVLSAPAAVVIASAASLFFGMRSLATRAEGAKPDIEPGFVTGTFLALALLAWHRSGLAVDLIASTAAVLFFGSYALWNARAAFRAVMPTSSLRGTEPSPTP